MGRFFIAAVTMIAVVGATQVQAGVALSKVSVDSNAAKASAPTAVVAKTPQGIACPLGIAQVKALDAERFEYAGKSYTMRELSRALRKANKPKAFDCIVIEGGTPPDVKDMVRVVKNLSSKPVNHVEWSGAKPDVIQQPNKK